MGKLTIGPSNALGSPIVQSVAKVVSEAPVVVERIVEVVKERVVEVPVEVVKYVDKFIEVPKEIVREVEKLVEVEIHHIQRLVPRWARWAVLIAVVEALVIAVLLESLH
jgi:hypothetical protein